MPRRASWCLLVAILAGAALAGDRASGDLKYNAGDYDGALKDYEEALAAMGPGANSEGVADLSLAIGRALFSKGDYARSQAVDEQSLAIYTRIHGSGHPTVARALSDIGFAIQATGDYAAAAGYLNRALAIARKTPEDAVIIAILERLAYNHERTADHLQAKLFEEQALDLIVKRYGPDDPATGQSLRLLSQILTELGDFPGARRQQLRALAILQKRVGEDAVEVGDTLVVMSSAARDSGDLINSREYAERALAIYEKRLGPRNTRVGGALDSLGQTLTEMRHFAEARTAFERALAIQTAELAPRHPWTANVIQGLAKEEAGAGNYARAHELLLENLSIWREALGPTHSFTMVSMMLLADVLAHQGRYREALATALDAARIRRDTIALTVRSVAERQALGYAALHRAGMDVALSIVERPGTPVSDRIAAWDALIRSRALVLDEMAARHHSIHQSADPAIADLAQRTAAARSAIATLILQGAGKSSPAEYGARIDRSRAELEGLEQDLARESAAFRSTLVQRRAGYEQVRAALPLGSGLVAFRRYERKSYPGGGVSTASYMAFVLGADRIPVAIPLGRASKIEALVTAWRAEIDREQSSLGRAAQANETAYRKAGEALRMAVWDPVQRRLAGVRRLFLVPDGALQLVNFAALPVEGGRYLVESGPLAHVLSAERDLTAPARTASGSELLAVANPRFQSAPGKVAGTATFRGARSSCTGFAQVQFGELPASAAEAGAILAIWRSRGWHALELSGAAATESAVKTAASGKRVLHLATHGFFLDSACPESGAARENPLIRSGLALAGANRRQDASRDEEDGVLTAQEVASLDLENTEWVVLSGCDTGVGDIADGEGVLGLRRAFQEAGARTLIVSLWPVQDQDAQRWMTTLYRARFVDRNGTAEAIRAASVSQLQARRVAGQSTHPFYWAGFIAAGDWR